MDVSAPQFMIGAKLPADCGGELLLRRLDRLAGAALPCRDLLPASTPPSMPRARAQPLVRAGLGPCASYAVLGGESLEPGAACSSASPRPQGKAAAGGLDAAAFERCRRAEYGIAHPGAGAPRLPGRHARQERLCRLRLPARLRAAARNTREGCAAFIKEYLARTGSRSQ